MQQKINLKRYVLRLVIPAKAGIQVIFKMRYLIRFNGCSIINGVKMDSPEVRLNFRRFSSF